MARSVPQHEEGLYLVWSVWPTTQCPLGPVSYQQVGAEGGHCFGLESRPRCSALTAAHQAGWRLREVAETSGRPSLAALELYLDQDAAHEKAEAARSLLGGDHRAILRSPRLAGACARCRRVTPSPEQRSPSRKPQQPRLKRPMGTTGNEPQSCGPCSARQSLHRCLAGEP